MEDHHHSRVPRKDQRSDIKGFDVVLAETGLALSLALLVFLFRVPIGFEQEFEVPEVRQITVELEDVEQTQQIERPPPPPRPPVPVMVPDDAVLEDEIIEIDAEIDIDEPAYVPPPPPPAVEEEEEPEIFVVVEQMPEIIGGIEALYAVLEYPELARKAGIDGLVVVQFVIEKDGTPTQLTVMKSASEILDAEAVRAVSQLRFKPGLQRGKPVRVKFAMPVRFSLRDADMGPAG
jgi:protein TonB